jgi:regulation of enolase protein 1 (concanavalin A-like superfamily)
MQWLNEPPQWSKSDRKIIVKTAPKTDFWRITHYGFIRDNGHFYFDAIATDFTVMVTIRGSYRDLYDQAGIMIRADEQHWLKTGIEYVDGVQNLSAVVTHTYSDWSMTPLKSPADACRLRIDRRREALHLFYGDPSSGEYIPFRMTYLPTAEPLQVGIMCASPQGEGYEVVFEDYQLEVTGSTDS